MASSSSLPSLSVRELPLFPLPDVVLFPGRPLPLHIFEFRYRILTNTVLDGDRRFGVLRFDPVQGTVADIGCCAEIVHHQRLPDDRFKMLTVGQQRFRVLEYLREKPYRVGLVEWMEDEPPAENLQPVAQEVEQLLRDVVKLSAKLTGQQIELPEDLPALPRELSYWVASTLYDVANEQQSLLEMRDTLKRLQRESEILASTRNHLAARSALKDALG